MKLILSFAVNKKKISVYELESGDDVHYDPLGRGDRNESAERMPHFIYDKSMNFKYLFAINDLFRMVI